MSQGDYQSSSNFPTTPGAFQTTLRRRGPRCLRHQTEADGSALIYSTYLGGSGDDQASAIAVDASGNAYVTGFYRLLPISPPLRAPSRPLSAARTSSAAFVSKLNATGSALLYSTYLGGSER